MTWWDLKFKLMRDEALEETHWFDLSSGEEGSFP
jgi:hypothetical protein